MKKLLLVGVLLLTGIHAKQVTKSTDRLANNLQDIIFKKKKSKSKNTKNTKSLIRTARSYLGTRYRFGGTSKRGIDCSGFTQNVMKKHGKKLPRTASQQASVGKHIQKKHLKAGDLVFFKGTYKKGISHVGIMISKSQFIHASSGAKKVTITSINKKYYQQHYAGARRV